MHLSICDSSECSWAEDPESDHFPESDRFIVRECTRPTSTDATCKAIILGKSSPRGVYITYLQGSRLFMHGDAENCQRWPPRIDRR